MTIQDYQPRHLRGSVDYQHLVEALREQASVPPKKRTERKAQMNSQITTTVIDDFDDFCAALGYPRQVVLEQLMRAAVASRPDGPA